MPRVIVSAGHTTKNPGTTINGLKEVDANRKIAKALIADLRRNGILTLAVPYEPELVQKINWINNTGYSEDNNDIAIEIHSNEADGTKSGTEAWFKDRGNNKSQQLADLIVQYATKESGLPNQGSKSEYDHELGGLAFVHNTYPVSVLIESLYMDNPNDRAFLDDDNKVQTLASGIAKGVLKFLNIDYRDNNASQRPQPQAQVVTQPPKQQQQQQQVQPSPVQQPKPVAPTMIPNPPKPVAQVQPKPVAPAPKPIVNMPAAPTPKTFTPPATPGLTTQVPIGTPPAPMAGGFGAPPTSIAQAPAGGGNSYLANREQRKEMIKNNYIKILGREPNQSDLNYFLNIGINEDQLLKKMVDSQEHVDLVKSRQEVLQIKAKFHSQQAEPIQLRAENEDKSELMQHFNHLIYQKNQAITQLQQRISYLENYVRNAPQSLLEATGPKYKEPFVDRLFKFFSDRLG